MITEFLIDIIFGIINPFMNILPGIAGVLDNMLNSATLVSALRVFTEYLELVTYLIPVYAFKPIFAVIVAVWLFKVIISILKTLWGVLPIA